MIVLIPILLSLAVPSLADPNDWVNINYVLAQSKHSDQSTSSARRAVLTGASAASKGGPWSITKDNDILPPSRNPYDYLSWAPYHWPDCNWCSNRGTNHISNPSNGTSDDPPSDDPPSDDPPSDDPPSDDPPSEEPASPDSDHGNPSNLQFPIVTSTPLLFRLPTSSLSSDMQGRSQSRMVRLRRNAALAAHLPTLAFSSVPTPPPSHETSAPSSSEEASPSDPVMSGMPNPAQAPAHTTKGKCTPSPTTRMAPSATWTTCPYVVRDGKVNPDVRSLKDSPAFTHMTQAVLYNTFAHVLSADSSSSYVLEAVSDIDVFFLASPTAMHPNLNYGQLVRGPGPKGQQGTFTGLLDLRGLVRIVNAVMVLRASGASEWTSQREAGFKAWVGDYVKWLGTSPLAKKVASSGNNHGTFFVNQYAAAKMLLGDNSGATDVLKGYFSHQFLDQIAKTGEQPFEAKRTRPFHYRAFNLEAMITNAKLGDQLGLDFWTAKSKYGATIQTAVDFLMTVDPKSEDVLDAVPHVAAAAAAYGDPDGKYAAYLQRAQTTWKSQPYYFYDQTTALPHSPAGRKMHATTLDMANATTANMGPDIGGGAVTVMAMHNGSMPVEAEGDGELPTRVFECPAVFALVDQVELDDDILVTCEDLKPFYEGMPLLTM